MDRNSYWLLTFSLVLALTLAAAAAFAQERTGPWVDDVIMSEEASPTTAITRLDVGEIDLYATAVNDPDLFLTVQENPRLDYELSYGSYSEVTYNTAGPVFQNGKLNPFAIPRIREATNWLIDRDYIVQEIYGGMAAPRFLAINTVFPDYALLADVARELELKYAHDFAKADAVITEEMEKLGAYKVEGVWHYEGEPVELIGLIRIEDERLDFGDYFANLFEDLGFQVIRDYKSAADASPIWTSTDPALGQFHWYTGGWVTTLISRDVGTNFSYFYTPRGLPWPLWQAYSPTPEFDEVSSRLERRDFTNLEERRNLLALAAELSLEDSTRIWTVDQRSFFPRRAELSIASDLSGGPYGTFLWPHTIRLDNRVGGSVNIALQSMMTEPWNPVAGTNWIYDMMPIRSTGDMAAIPDPFTGLQRPQRIERAEVTIKEGLPVGKTLDWVDLDFAPEITVPEDAWFSWDAESQTFITVGEAHPEGLTANRKSVVYYPKDLYTQVKWHDGSSFSIGDVLLGMILTWERADEASPIFDAAYVPEFQIFLQTFKGVKIVSTDPLVIETYVDSYTLDAENNVATWWPFYSSGQGAWHNVSLGIMAESAGELAFSSAKSDRLEVEWMSYIAGPSLSILNKHLQNARASAYIPYEPTLGQYISSDEAQARWDNLAAWYTDKRHFWIGTGPFYLERAFPVEKVVHLKRNPDFPDPADKWALFSEPMIAEVEISGPIRVVIGAEASFDVDITFAGDAYPSENIEEVKYLLFDSRGNLVITGEAEQLDEGWYGVNLAADATSQLTVGSNRLEVVVVSNLVSIPTFEAIEFVSTP